ncbi:lysosome membrane protein 2-like [Panonychus citri]|uniref:lysosome membrane protein 2-like n=1 Tax=Panonychus citri TaxID=50023 RepID=UPI0023073CB9|nr:lysosome membrane protein 2-like [Panonychus citri]
MTYTRRNCFISGLIGGGLMFCLSAILTYLLSPYLIKYIVSQRLILSSPTSDTYSGWKLAPIPIYVKFYFFNVTNPKEIINGSEPILKELGPYTFLEVREKINVTWNHHDGLISYQQVARYHPIPEMTVGSLNDTIVHLNVPLAGMLNQAKRKADAMIYGFVEQVAVGNGDDLFLNHTASELLFKGYHDELLEFIEEAGLSPVRVSPFSFFGDRNNTNTDGSFTIYSGESGTLSQFGLLHSWNNEKQLNIWNDSKCNSFNSAWPGDLRPPYPSSDPEELYLFAPDLCRSLTLTYLSRRSTKGVDTIRYWLSPSLFDYNLDKNKCYCNGQSCPANGIFNISICTHGSPASISFPHYLFADPVYTKNIQGLHPDPEKHSFYMDIEPNLGVPVDTKARVQINMMLEKDDEIDFTSNLKASINLPIFWRETSATISDDLISQLILLQKHVPNIITIATFTQVTIAVALMVVTLIFVLRMNTINELVPRQSKPTRKPFRPTPTRPSKKAYKTVMTTSFES